MLKVEIDPGSGFCGGVIRAITRAESYLSGEDRLYSLGDIVHNEAELFRLQQKGLVTAASLEEVPQGGTVLIRAHGEPPATYQEAISRKITLIDCSCPVVLRLQKSIREAYARLHSEGLHGQVIIFGRVGHAEVLGLVGQVGGDALVVENAKMLEDMIDSLDFSQPMEIFSQTTKSPTEYEEICNLLFFRGARLVVHNTICAQVASRHEKLAAFASSHDVILFVSGKSSSNGKVLSDLCRSANSRTHLVGSAAELDPSWFREGESVGVCGATSTPKWLLEQVADAVSALK
ncbi:MAG: 4-hydroxy-3-methylbut-2-enyl diphosphate reductase [Bacteroidales bacterium]|nr:4-hydroxy-3-methylbut-2-enyl diphosphate reductase [Bacteroidales bacterium]MBQ9702183.1 4-hydroxy-3-methylbut-2-enyl diphosphate reductase [Bacteroidales bacterium]MBR1782202.1 4-hydroxy-3-methylbut-2-enyl diphosphate reductase [Bacteroidales bacterium]